MQQDLTDGSRRKLSHESSRNGVASLLAEEAASGFTKRNLADPTTLPYD